MRHKMDEAVLEMKRNIKKATSGIDLIAPTTDCLSARRKFLAVSLPTELILTLWRGTR